VISYLADKLLQIKLGFWHCLWRSNDYEEQAACRFQRAMYSASEVDVNVNHVNPINHKLQQNKLVWLKPNSVLNHS
jgi:hypothetical protein